jgi:hypothetical protein
LDPAPFFVGTPRLAAQFGRVSAVASNGKNYLVVWEDNMTSPAGTPAGRILGSFVENSELVQQPITIMSVMSAPAFLQLPAVASNGRDYLVVWERAASAFDFRTDAARIDASGTVLDPNGISLTGLAGYPGLPLVASNGTNYLVMTQSGGLYGTRLNANGIVLDASAFLIAAPPQHPDNYVGSMAGATLSASGSELPGDYLVAFQIEDFFQTPTCRIVAQRVTADGRILDGGLLTLSTDSPPGDRPVVASAGGGSFLVVNQSASTSRLTGHFIVPDAVSLRGSKAVISWPGQPGKKYRVQFTADLAAPDWQDLPGEVVIAGSRGAKLDEDIGNAQQRFYRVTELP